ncbi:Tn7-TnsA-like-N domain-containing protein [Ralstonia mannitolilytica]|uniref:TnsA endonuclease N-terminal domain-containing protein n=1 Tax=Ralstonia mannitolilytica TaxID=105219 RepID=UPI0028F54360|nr:TnsA endonuclease N-terminal domain-containing protein [Ralstonia mannitolilytica]CAJ0793481.1 hypothetical protein R77555_02496 [Ralstonia mannitolilytica]
MKKRRNITTADIERWRAAGLGRGRGPNYQPWLTIRDVASKGRKSRPWSLTTGRHHHLLSDNELHFFLYSEFAEEVVDIREQFPLFPQEETVRFAEELGISHQRYPGTSTPIVLTTDFLLTIRRPDGEIEHRAYGVKSSSELQGEKRKRVLEKLQLERQYWLARNIAWRLITEREFDRVRLTNLEWLSYLAYPELKRLETRIPEFLWFVRDRWRRGTQLQTLLDEAADGLALASRADADQLFRHCVWQHLIEIDMSALIGPRHPVILLQVRSYDSQRNDFESTKLSA